MNKKLNQIIFVLLMLAASVSQAQVDTFTVTKTTDFDPFLYQDNPDDTAIVGTLQWAIRKSNDAVNPCLIIFNIPGNGTHTITLTYQLPSLNNEITIDATTQAGYTQGNPAVMINGDSRLLNCFVIYNNNCTIKAVYIQNFKRQGIIVSNVDGFLIEQNTINRIIAPFDQYKPCTIGASGIYLNNSINGIIKGNIIGTDVNLTTGMGIWDYGIMLYASENCLIGGIDAIDANIIAFCKAGINHPSGCMQYRKNKFLNNDKAFANISNRCSELPLSVPVLFDTYTSEGFTSGTAQPGSTIDIFGINENTYNANEYLTSAVADNNGNWSAVVSTQYLFLTGIETDINNCSSILSAAIEQTTAATGTTCTAAIPLPPVTFTCSGTQLQISDTVLWMKFTADTSSMRIAINNSSQTPVADIKKMYLYIGDCGNLQLITMKDKTAGDNLIINQSDFIAGSEYFLKVVQQQAITGNFEVCIKSLSFEFCDFVLYDDTVCPGDTVYGLIFQDGATVPQFDELIFSEWDTTAYWPTNCDNGMDGLVFSYYPAQLVPSHYYNGTLYNDWYLFNEVPILQANPVHYYANYHFFTFVIPQNTPSGCYSVANGVNMPPQGHQINNDLYSGLLGGFTHTLCVLSDTFSNNIIASDTIICSGSCVTLSPDTIQAGNSYNWYNQNWANIGSSDSIIVCPTNTTTYHLIDSNKCGKDTSHITIQVIEQPSVIVTCNGSTSGCSICPDHCASLAANAYNAGNIPMLYTYNWYEINWPTFTLIGNGQNIIVCPTTTTTYMVQVTDTCGNISYNNIVVTVNPQPVASIIENTTLCFGDSLFLNANPAGGLFIGNGITNPGYIINGWFYSQISGSGTFNIQYIVTNSYGCKDTAYTIIKVNPKPHVHIVSLTNDSMVCIGSTETFNLNAVVSNLVNPGWPFGPMALYLWNNGATTQSISVTLTPTTLVPFVYSVTITDVWGTCTDVDTFIINVIQAPPTPQYSINPACLYQGAPITFSPQILSPVYGIVNASWNFGDNTSSNQLNPAHNFSTHGYHNISVSLQNDCGTTTSCKPEFVLPDDCACPQNVPYSYTLPNDVTVTTTTWDETTFSSGNEIYIQNTIFVQSYNTLTIKPNMTLRFGPKGRIVVKTRATLKISDNVTFTSIRDNCNAMWQGIEVWGYSNLASNNIIQGRVITTGGGIRIINAHIGILLGKRADVTCTINLLNPYILANGGGLIKARKNMAFINCGVGIKILRKSTVTEDNQFSIQKCTFRSTTLTDPYYDSDNIVHYPNKYNPWADSSNTLGKTVVGLWMNGISLHPDSLINSFFFNVQTGIKAFDASYSVKNCNFDTLYSGIRSYHTSSALQVGTINDCKFNHINLLSNSVGIYISGGLNNKIFKNKFGDPTNLSQGFVNIGIWMNNSAGFTIGDPSLLNINTFYRNTTGVRLTKSNSMYGALNSLVLQNDFIDTRTNLLTNSNNANVQVRCNNFNYNTTQTGFTYYRYMLNTPNSVFVNQGTMTQPAGNFFIHNQSGSGFPREIDNLTAVTYEYYHKNLFTHIPQNYYKYSLVNTGITDNNCYSANFVNYSVSQSISELSYLKTVLQTLQQQYNAVQQNLDKGNTVQLLNAITGNTPQGNLKNLLVKNSPLSDTVLIILHSSNKLSNGNYKNVMEINLPVTDNVNPYFFSKLELLPTGIANQLITLQGNNPGINTPASIQSRIYSIKADRDMLLSYLLDTLMKSGDLVTTKQVLEAENTVNANMVLAAMYLNDSNLTAAQSKINAVPSATQDLQDWHVLYNLLYNLAANGKTLFDMDSLQLQTITELAYSGRSNIAVTNAQNILTLLFNIEFDSEIIEAGTNARYTQQTVNSDLIIENKVEDTAAFLGDNYPNPFNQKTLIPYFILENAIGAINIYDSRGIRLKSIPLNNAKSETELDTKQWSNGVYFYSLSINGVEIAWKKMILIK